MYYVYKNRERVMGPFEEKAKACHVARKMSEVGIKLGKLDSWKVKEEEDEC